jgi:hypothetical protein
MRQFAALSFSDTAGPTPCDVAQVRKAYEALALRPAPVAVVPEDEGEEPVPDDTPLVVPEP